MHSHPVLFGKFLRVTLNSVWKSLWADSYVTFLGLRHRKKAAFGNTVCYQNLGG
jgi:hypothetical protein